MQYYALSTTRASIKEMSIETKYIYYKIVDKDVIYSVP